MSTKAPPRLRIEIYHRRLRGGRLNISAGTSSEKVRAQRIAALEVLMERGDWDTIERVRLGLLDISDVQRAVREGDWAALQPAPVESAPLPPILMGQAFDDALETIRATCEEHTHSQYRSMTKYVLAHFTRDQPLDGVTIAMAEKFLHAPRISDDPRIRGKVWAPRTQDLYAMWCAQVWGMVIERESEAAEVEEREPRLTRNPWKKKRQGGIRLPRIRLTRHAWLRPPQWRALAAHCEGTPQLALYGLGCLAGLRQTEATHLRPGHDLDLEGRVITVQPRKGEHRWGTKTDNSVRFVEFEDELYQILKEHFRRGYAGERFVIRPFTSDQPPAPSTVQEWTKRDFKAVGIAYGRQDGDALTFHSLRHTFASWLAQQDVSLKLIAELMGDTVETVSKFYAHLQPSNRRRAATILDRVAREGE